MNWRILVYVQVFILLAGLVHTIMIVYLGYVGLSFQSSCAVTEVNCCKRRLLQRNKKGFIAETYFLKSFAVTER